MHFDFQRQNVDVIALPEVNILNQVSFGINPYSALSYNCSHVARMVLGCLYPDRDLTGNGILPENLKGKLRMVFGSQLQDLIKNQDILPLLSRIKGSIQNDENAINIDTLSEHSRISNNPIITEFISDEIGSSDGSIISHLTP